MISRFFKGRFNKLFFKKTLVSSTYRYAIPNLQYQCLNPFQNINYAPKFQFSSSFGCKKIENDIEELSETMFNNEQHIIDKIRNRGINVTSFLLDSFSHFPYSNPEIYKIVFENLENSLPECFEPETLISIADSIFYLIELISRFRQNTKVAVE